MEKQYRRLTLACYTESLSMAVVCNLPPVLFLTFRTLFGLSYTQLGLLIFINYTTQLLVDMLFSFFPYKFNIAKTVKFTPILTVVGMLVYSLWHLISPGSVYLGFVIGTVIFSAAAGLCEVLISPVIAAIPSDNPERQMSRLHSVYAWGVAPVVALGTLFLLLFGAKLWYVLILVFTVVPISSVILFCGVCVPEVATPEKSSDTKKFFRDKTLWLCVLAIFMGGATECNMSQWASGYVENALGLPKVWGDIFGVAMFGIMLGLGRTLYTKFGKHLFRVLIFGSLTAFLCYLVAVFSPNAVVGMVACALVGFCSSMLWPGTLVVAADKFSKSGVLIYAMMAAGGDMGASVVPQLVGMVTDFSIGQSWIISWANSISISAEQLAMRIGILVSAIFPLIGTLLLVRLWKASVFKGKEESIR
ncbi:MAG: MFS transporter [Clostridia bacterium]|nr:MFS transporter [Clostridia bacterium]